MPASTKGAKEGRSLRGQEKKSKEFRGFQTRYLLVYVLTMFADWLQGTHMYALYDGYVSDQGTAEADVGPYHPSDYGKAAISTLFITGFACKLTNFNRDLLDAFVLCIFNHRNH